MALEITIDQTEIETAIKNHIGTLLTINDGQEVSIDLKAGRGENGFSASVKIGGNATGTSATEAAAPQAAGPTVSGPFKRNVKATPAQPQEAAQTTAQADEGDTSTDTQTTSTEAQADPVATAGDDAGLDEAAPAASEKKGGLFAHLPNRTGTDKAE